MSSMEVQLERAFLAPNLEIRVADDAGEDSTEFRIEGVAAPFDTFTEIGDYFHERFAKGAFKETLSSDDQSLLVGHDGLPIARTGNGHLSFKEAKEGLSMEAILDTRDTTSSDIRVKIERGDVSGLSVGFYALRDEWDDLEEDMPKRTIHEARLVEVSIVADPAYKDTSVGLRGAVLERALSTRKRTNGYNIETERRRKGLALKLARHRMGV